VNIPRTRLTIVELCLLAALVAILSYSAGRYRTEVRLQPFLSRTESELEPLAQRYGPSHHSRYGEEWILRDFFQGQRGGVFVDVGANDYQRDSNTYFLETSLGWSGVAIEPQQKFAAGYASHRPKTRFVPMFVSDASHGRATLHVPRDNDLVASSDPAFVEAEGGDDVQTQVADTSTLDDILTSNAIQTVDFLSIDVELHEPAVLKGFSIGRFKPRLVVIEAHPAVRQQILDYFAGHGYVVIGKYLRADTENLWFMPFAGA
jgi:FkbM family methyltransferase